MWSTQVAIFSVVYKDKIEMLVSVRAQLFEQAGDGAQSAGK